MNEQKTKIKKGHKKRNPMTAGKCYKRCKLNTAEMCITN